MDNSLKGLLLAAGIVITLVVVGIAFYISNSGQDSAAEAMDGLSSQMGQLSTSDAKLYDGSENGGATVISAIKNLSEKYTVVVINATVRDAATAIADASAPTLTEVNAKKSATNTYADGATYYSIATADAIVKTAKFYGSVFYDANGDVEYIVFVQKK